MNFPVRKFLLYGFLVLLYFRFEISLADRILIVRGTGYNKAGKELVAEIRKLGHTVDEDSIANSMNNFPKSITSRCTNSSTGYDWLGIFTNTPLDSSYKAIEKFIKEGGKVFCQYEVSCCTQSSNAVAGLLAYLTGLDIKANINDYVGFASGKPGWYADNVNCCVRFVGAAYKGLDNLPEVNQLKAEGVLNGGVPNVNVSSNFGFYFQGSDFKLPGCKGAIVGVGDINLWYDGYEPYHNGGKNPVNKKIVEFFFPNSGSKCFLYPPGCGNIQSGKSGKPISLGPDKTLCMGDSMVYQFSDYDSLIWNKLYKSSKFIIRQSGTYTVKTYSKCGESFDTVNLDFINTPVSDLRDKDTLCKGETILVKIKDSTAQIRWQDGSPAQLYSISLPGVYIVELKNGICISRDTITVYQPKSIKPELGPDKEICPSGVVLLSDINKIQLHWPGGLQGTLFTVNKSSVVIAESRNICDTLKDTVEVKVLKVPEVQLGKDSLYCNPETVELKNLAGNTPGTWENGDTTFIRTIDRNGLYIFSSRNICGESKDSIKISFENFQKLNRGRDTILCKFQTLKLSVRGNGTTYQWDDGSRSPDKLVTEAGTYKVTVSKGYCLFTDSITVEYLDHSCECKLLMPDAFSPGDDGTNDYFTSVSNCKGLEQEMYIFNRWGELIFSSKGADLSWDGSYKGNIVPMGVYMYRLNWIDPLTGFKYTLSGTVTLLR